MPEYAKPMARLIEELRRLPGIGSKSAQRIAFHVLKAGTHDVERLTAALRDVKESIRLCDLCNNVTEVTPCAYCADPSRNAKLLCVIEGPEDILAIEKTGQYRGYYHVLHGALSPLHGIGPEQLRTANLVERLKSGAAEEVEVIIATNPNVEGEATAVYLSKLLKPLGVRVTRIALGMPVGGDLEYTDQVTISKAMEGRREI
ncbi:MAG: recombination mediator RecR [Acidobacteria bacterium]|nr:recombination protein RecR [Acidobacteriota bacterium]MCZ6491883.1 recombination mediator RecR [Acidobacteriota bacterium]MCZ6753212.1 recombination mediator RecR [Acidobacteriota bacterium]